MATEITCTSLLKPATSFQSSDTLIPLTIFDRTAFPGHVPNIIVFQSPTPSNKQLKHGLSQVLSHFPHAAGRLTFDSKHQLCIALNNAGIRVIEVRVSSTLCKNISLEGTKNLKELYPSTDEGIEELMQVQLNRYMCGGLVIGLTCHHFLGDGQSISNFCSAWAQTVRTPGMHALATPFLDRGAIVVPRKIPMTSFDHANIEFKKVEFDSHWNKAQNLTVHFSVDFISDLKALVPGGCTKFECLLSHLWKKITVARGLKETDFTEIRIAINCRGRVKPAVPLNFFGNMVLWAYPRLCVKDLLTLSYAQVVIVIRKAVAQVDDTYIKSFIDFGAIASEKGEQLSTTYVATGTSLSPHLEINSWLGFRFSDLDFGFGQPSAFFQPNEPIEGTIEFSPSCKERGGVDVFLALSEDRIDVFRQICYSIEESAVGCKQIGCPTSRM
ncbi:HXXXD-type acyl-transferase family protein [Rhynchospora pubera]|uniref:HXXXD-type acyl-transferase family protein n=1 Tax=Rhynchospora pubera TaxID=906938 RepID=A0AAV8GHL7_9POAL|nr:HXXXD-type acyl-transferase family protein [Rhynchospora pubera]